MSNLVTNRGACNETPERHSIAEEGVPASPVADQAGDDLEHRVTELTGVIEDLLEALLLRSSLSFTDLSPATQTFMGIEECARSLPGPILADDDIPLP